jgi:hypothetical protein
MRKRIVLTFAVGLMASVASQAAACLPNTTVAALIALAGNGCTVDDKMFTNFAYTGQGQAPAASGVDAILVVNPSTLTFGWDIGPPNSSFTGNFTFAFTVSEVPDPVTCPAGICPIIGRESQMFPANAPANNQNQTVAVSFNTVPPSSVTLDNQSLAGNTGITTISPGSPRLGSALRQQE